MKEKKLDLNKIRDLEKKVKLLEKGKKTLEDKLIVLEKKLKVAENKNKNIKNPTCVDKGTQTAPLKRKPTVLKKEASQKVLSD